jgi:hypothetical protein
MKIIGIVIAVVLELSVYGIVYYFGYKHGKYDSDEIRTNIQFDIGKVANNDK